MTRKDRLERIIRGQDTDRSAVNFYEIGGFDIDTSDQDPFNVYSSSSWVELINFAMRETDLIFLRTAKQISRNEAYDEFFSREEHIEGESRFTRTTLNINGKTLTARTRRDAEVHTTWTLEHLLKDVEDLRAYLDLPDEIFAAEFSADSLYREEQRLGDRGIIMVDTADPLCIAASLFSMENYTIIALTEQALFHSLLEKIAGYLFKHVQAISRAFPGHLWRICGPEYATEPYLPPSLFEEYVNRYTGPLVRIIHQNGGFARLHCHGRLKTALPYIAEMGVDAIDPIEPPPQGDVDLEFVTREYGAHMSLFGNIEVSDIENVEPAEFELIAGRSLEAGRKARGFALMPSASPYGREITERTMENYKTLVRLTKA